MRILLAAAAFVLLVVVLHGTRDEEKHKAWVAQVDNIRADVVAGRR